MDDPGSTSTKANIFENDVEVWKSNIAHSPEELEAAGDICDQGPMRRDAVLAAAREAGQDVSSIDGLIGFAESERGKSFFGAEKAAGLAAAAKKAKADGTKYCICPACTAGGAILDNKALLS